MRALSEFLNKIRRELEYRFSKRYELARKEAKFFASTGLSEFDRAILRDRELVSERIFTGKVRNSRRRVLRTKPVKRELGADDIGLWAAEEISGVSTINRIVDFFT